jgi:hypothetical protein
MKEKKKGREGKGWKEKRVERRKEKRGMKEG